MAKHADKSITDGQGNYDHTKTKDVQDLGGGRHSSEDKGEKDQGPGTSGKK